MDLEIRLDRTGPVLLSHQIGRALVDLIASRALQAGVRLPSTRALAEQLGVARMTVVEAYAWLAEQGYVDARHGSGTVVRPLHLLPQATPPPTEAAPETKAPAIDFRPGLPDLKAFPRATWAKLLARAARDTPAASLGYGDRLGSPRLRRAIAAYLHRSRGLVADPAHIAITVGAAQGVDIALRALQCRELIVEQPGHMAIASLRDIHDLKLREIPVDDEGLRTDLLPRRGANVRVAYVLPSHQFPRGCVMSMARRTQLLEWAGSTDAFVIEDDYDSEFAHDGRPVVPLARLDTAGRVIYSGTFSKTLVPALRLGFMIVPPALMERFALIKWWADYGGNLHQQEALATWIEDGSFERHILRMRRLYRDRFAVLKYALARTLGDRVTILGQPVGMHAAVLIRDADARALAAAARAKGVGLHPVDIPMADVPANAAAFVIGFGNVGAAEIAQGIDVLAAAVNAGRR